MGDGKIKKKQVFIGLQMRELMLFEDQLSEVGKLHGIIKKCHMTQCGNLVVDEKIILG